MDEQVVGNIAPPGKFRVIKIVTGVGGKGEMSLVGDYSNLFNALTLGASYTIKKPKLTAVEWFEKGETFYVIYDDSGDFVFSTSICANQTESDLSRTVAKFINKGLLTRYEADIIFSK